MARVGGFRGTAPVPPGLNLDLTYGIGTSTNSAPGGAPAPVPGAPPRQPPPESGVPVPQPPPVTPPPVATRPPSYPGQQAVENLFSAPWLETARAFGEKLLAKGVTDALKHFGRL